MYEFIPNTRIIHNPRVDELPVSLVETLNSSGVVKPLCYGKIKGFRVEYGKSTKEQVLELLTQYGIEVLQSTEFNSPRKSYLNVHVIRIPREGYLGNIVTMLQTELFESDATK